MPLYDYLAQKSTEFYPEIIRIRRDLNSEKRDLLKYALKVRAQADLRNYGVWFACSVLGILSTVLVTLLIFERKQGPNRVGTGIEPAPPTPPGMRV